MLAMDLLELLSKKVRRAHVRNQLLELRRLLHRQLQQLRLDGLYASMRVQKREQVHPLHRDLRTLQN